jgi:hypothetical protein
MSSETQELIRICEQLPTPKRALLTTYARSLLVEADDTPPIPPATSDQADATARVATQFGFAKGLIEMRDDFDAPLDEFAEYR